MTDIFLAHILAVTGGSNSLPVVGNPATALVFALLFTAAILLLYLVIDHLPKPRKNRITPRNEPKYAKAMIAIVILSMLSISWDVWWHRAIGRDSLWIWPHIGIYSFTSIAIALGFYVWRHCRDPLWKHVMFVLLFIPISLVFDNYFHSIFGVENYANPIRLSWSPGHVMLGLSIMFTLVLLLEILLKFRKTPDFSFFGSLCFGGIFPVVFVLLLPFHPTEGWGQVAGFAGAGMLAAGFLVVAFTAEKVMAGNLDATFMSIFSLMILLTTYGKETAPQIVMMPHDRPPIWLFIFSFLVPAILLDLTKDRFQMWTRGLFAGTVWSAILFGFSTQFFAPKFQYGLPEIFTAIVFSALGGLAVGSAFSLFHLTDEKHLEKLLKKW
jgi:hypothetical protein